jgi:hypothetical protein
MHRQGGQRRQPFAWLQFMLVGVDWRDIMDLTPYDPAEVARLKARPDCHGALMRFAIHVEEVCPTNVWPHLFFAIWAADEIERHYYLARAVEAGERQLQSEADGTATRRRDQGEDVLFRRALFDRAVVAIGLGFPDTAARAVARLLELDPEDSMGAIRMARKRGIFPEAAAETASAMTM